MPTELGISNPAIRTLLLCDLVASTQLVERIGDSAAADLLARHDRIARDLLPTFNDREIDKSDGFLLLVERPIEAVRFALAYQAKLAELGAPTASEVLDAAKAAPLPSRHATKGAIPEKPLLAVLAFDNLSSDPEMHFFSDGVSEEIIQRLSRGARLKVIGRTSSFQFRGERKAEAAQSLHCSHVLDGAIRRAADRVRISAHLVEASSNTTLWADRYDRSLEDIFEVQDEISENIARALDQTFSSFSTRAVDPAVYDLYLRASPKSFAPDELRTHVGVLEVVTQRAPHFAEAWGRLAYLRFARLCARLGSSSSGWPRTIGPIAPTKPPTISGASAPRRNASRRTPSGSDGQMEDDVG